MARQWDMGKGDPGQYIWQQDMATTLRVREYKRQWEAYRRRNNDLSARLRQFHDMEPAQTYLSGQYMINAAGEAQTEIIFPVTFIDKPLISFGFEMKEG